MPQEEKDHSAGSRFLSFWSSLPGVLTGIAAVVAAVATLAALFTGEDDAAPGAGLPAAVGAEPSTVPGAGDEDCFGEYFKGIPETRLGTVEAGAYVDVLSESEPKAGPIGITFTDFGRLIGGIRFAFFPANTFFKIESVVDGSCRPVEDYENELGGDKHSWRDSSAVTVSLNGRFYGVTANGAGNIVRVSFVGVAR